MQRNEEGRGIFNRCTQSTGISCLTRIADERTPWIYRAWTLQELLALSRSFVLSEYATPTISFLNFIFLIFLATVLREPSACAALERAVPWEELA